MLLSGKRIYIVEDDLQNRMVYKMLLHATHGAELEFDRWGDGVLQSIEAFLPADLIVLDLMFMATGVNGYDIFTRLRANEHLQTIPIVAISASEPAQAMAKTRALGFSGFIAKPVDDELLPHQLLRLMAGERVWYAGDRFTTIPG